MAIYITFNGITDCKKQRNRLKHSSDRLGFVFFVSFV